MHLPPPIKNKKIVLLLTGCTIISISLVLLIIFTPFKSSVVSPLPKSAVLAETSKTESFPLPSQVIDLKKLGILLVGYGGAGHDGGYLTDAIQIAFFDFEKSKISLISIPRDLWVKTALNRETKINAVILDSATDKKNLISSGASGLKEVLTNITGLPITYFFSVDFVGLQRVIGINLKGIDVNVAETLEDPWYPVKGKELETCDLTTSEINEVSSKYSGFELERQFPCRYKHLLFKPGINSMQGEQVLEYVRSRHGSTEGDVSRGKRQQEVIAAISKKLISFETIKDLPSFFTDIVKNMQTDVSLDIFKYLLPALQTAKTFQIKTINISTSNVLKNSTSQNGAFIMIPKAGMNKWDDLKEYIQKEVQ